MQKLRYRLGIVTRFHACPPTKQITFCMSLGRRSHVVSRSYRSTQLSKTLVALNFLPPTLISSFFLRATQQEVDTVVFANHRLATCTPTNQLRFTSVSAVSNVSRLKRIREIGKCSRHSATCSHRNELRSWTHSTTPSLPNIQQQQQWLLRKRQQFRPECRPASSCLSTHQGSNSQS